MKGFTPFPPDFAERYRRAGYWRGEVLGDLLREPAKMDPGRTAIVEPDRRWSYSELNDEVERVAAGLARCGIKATDRVVVQLPNVCSFASISIALFRLGAVPIFALAGHRRSEITYLCQYAQAVAYVCRDIHQGFDHRELARQVQAAVTSLRHVIIDGEPEEFIGLTDLKKHCFPQGAARPGGGDSRCPVPSAGDVALMLLSGGTTGRPKLIPRTHDDYGFQLRETARALGFDGNGVYLAVLPVAHNAALGCPGLLGALRAGGKVLLPRSASPEEALPMMRAEGVTLTTLTPPLALLWLESSLPEVDLSKMVMQVGAARFAPELARRVRSVIGCRLTQWFGMAEGLLTYTRLDDDESVTDNTQGRPLCTADEIRVVDVHDREVPAGCVGELLTRGPYTLRAYYDASEHNEQMFTSDGFLRTGDLVRFTPAGNMIVEGRIKDVINRGGEKIAAREVEDLLLEHPSVREVAVVGIRDATLGERICAFVVAREAALPLDTARNFLRARGLADHKLPERIESVARLPQTPFGKIDKAELRALLDRKTAAAAAAAPQATATPAAHLSCAGNGGIS